MIWTLTKLKIASIETWNEHRKNSDPPLNAQLDGVAIVCKVRRLIATKGIFTMLERKSLFF